MTFPIFARVSAVLTMLVIFHRPTHRGVTHEKAAEGGKVAFVKLFGVVASEREGASSTRNRL